jgi:hypothetical protein
MNYETRGWREKGKKGDAPRMERMTRMRAAFARNVPSRSALVYGLAPGEGTGKNAWLKVPKPAHRSGFTGFSPVKPGVSHGLRPSMEGVKNISRRSGRLVLRSEVRLR